MGLGRAGSDAVQIGVIGEARLALSAMTPFTLHEVVRWMTGANLVLFLYCGNEGGEPDILEAMSSSALS